jgi:type II secretory pathway pseudopilin PulG
MKKSSCKNREGFTLAEAVMATVVLGIAAAGVLLPFTSGVSVRAEGEHRTLGAKLASDLMEHFVNTSFDELKELSDGGGDYVDEPQGHIVNNFDTAEEFTDPMYANFSRGASYEYDAGQPYFIIVTVWVKYNGKEIVTLKRLISE